jgi:hypothetical protein
MLASDLLDRDRMSLLLDTALHPAAGPFHITITSAQELASAAGRRCVVQYRVAGFDPAGSVLVVAKLFTEARRARLLYQHLHALFDGPFHSGRFGVPQPLALVAEENLVLYRCGLGLPLSQTAPTAADAREAARWLAALHTSDVRLPRSLDLAQEVASTQSWADIVMRLDPRLAVEAHRLAARWAPAVSARPSSYDVPIHKDFHADHVLLGSQVCVIDLDEARQGDPAFDLAHFCAYLEWRCENAQALRDAFLSEYARATGWSDDGSFLRYSAYTWLKIAKQIATRSGPCRTHGDRGWVPGDAVARGLACLGR